MTLPQTDSTTIKTPIAHTGDSTSDDSEDEKNGEGVLPFDGIITKPPSGVANHSDDTDSEDSDQETATSTTVTNTTKSDSDISTVTCNGTSNTPELTELTEEYVTTVPANFQGSDLHDDITNSFRSKPNTDIETEGGAPSNNGSIILDKRTKSFKNVATIVPLTRNAIETTKVNHEPQTITIEPEDSLSEDEGESGKNGTEVVSLSRQTRSLSPTTQTLETTNTNNESDDSEEEEDEEGGKNVKPFDGITTQPPSSVANHDDDTDSDESSDQETPTSTTVTYTAKSDSDYSTVTCNSTSNTHTVTERTEEYATTTTVNSQGSANSGSLILDKRSKSYKNVTTKLPLTGNAIETTKVNHEPQTITIEPEDSLSEDEGESGKNGTEEIVTLEPTVSLTRQTRSLSPTTQTLETTNTNSESDDSSDEEDEEGGKDIKPFAGITTEPPSTVATYDDDTDLDEFSDQETPTSTTESYTTKSDSNYSTVTCNDTSNKHTVTELTEEYATPTTDNSQRSAKNGSLILDKRTKSYKNVTTKVPLTGNAIETTKVNHVNEAITTTTGKGKATELKDNFSEDEGGSGKNGTEAIVTLEPTVSLTRQTRSLSPTTQTLETTNTDKESSDESDDEPVTRAGNNVVERGTTEAISLGDSISDDSEDEDGSGSEEEKVRTVAVSVGENRTDGYEGEGDEEDIIPFDEIMTKSPPRVVEDGDNTDVDGFTFSDQEAPTPTATVEKMDDEPENEFAVNHDPPDLGNDIDNDKSSCMDTTFYVVFFVVWLQIIKIVSM